MLVGFVGIPSSGKTTQAAETFVRLKKMGVITEFVTEVARQYIAAKRQGIGEGAQLVLTDEDQGAIFKRQADLESLMKDPRSITISDSSPLNSLIYMSHAKRGETFDSGDPLRVLDSYDLLVICNDRPSLSEDDPNRIHGPEVRQQLSQELADVIDWIKAGRPDLTIMEVQYDFADQIAFKAVDLFYQKASK